MLPHTPTNIISGKVIRETLLQHACARLLVVHIGYRTGGSFRSNIDAPLPGLRNFPKAYHFSVFQKRPTLYLFFGFLPICCIERIHRLTMATIKHRVSSGKATSVETPVPEKPQATSVFDSKTYSPYIIYLSTSFLLTLLIYVAAFWNTQWNDIFNAHPSRGEMGLGRFIIKGVRYNQGECNGNNTSMVRATMAGFVFLLFFSSAATSTIFDRELLKTYFLNYFGSWSSDRFCLPLAVGNYNISCSYLYLAGICCPPDWTILYLGKCPMALPHRPNQSQVVLSIPMVELANALS